MQSLDDVTCARLAQFEVLTAEWQLAAARFPQWITEPGHEPYRPIATLACGLELDDLGRGNDMRCAGQLAQGLVDAMLNLATHPDVDYLPSLVLLRDAELLAQLRPSLEPLGIELRLAKSLPLIEAVELRMRQGFTDPHSVDAWTELMGAIIQPRHELKYAIRALHAAEHHVGAARLAGSLEPHVADPAVLTYLRMRWELSSILWAIRDRAGALAHHRAILNLAPSDPLGIRPDLIARLIREGKADMAFDVVGELRAPYSALESYASALVAFALIGDCDESRAELKCAIRTNQYAAKYLTPSARAWIPRKEDIEPGNTVEGMMIRDRLEEAWAYVDGAQKWLRKVRGAKTRG